MKPILFNAEMTKAILDGRKTQTRRLISSFFDNNKNKCSAPDINYKLEGAQGFDTLCALWYDEKKEHSVWAKSKYQIGDILWVREPVKISVWTMR